jgi:hypothetical protein
MHSSIAFLVCASCLKTHTQALPFAWSTQTMLSCTETSCLVPQITCYRFLQAVVLPKLPRRQYFLFSQPIYTDGIDKTDKESCAALYSKLKQNIFQGIEVLLEARKSDKYDDPKRRLPFEAIRPFGDSQAPTFSMEQINAIQGRLQQ